MKMTRINRGSYIQGQFVKVTDVNGTVTSRNPGDLEQSEVAVSFSFDHINEAVSAARHCFSIWKRMPASDRYAAILRYRNALNARAEEVTQLISFETGKPLWEAYDELSETLTIIDYWLDNSKHPPQMLNIENAYDQMNGVVRFLPHGVLTVICPSILPVFAPHFHMIAALAYGNTIVLKSPQYAPATCQCIAEIVHQAGLPAGAINIIHGDAEVGRRLVSHHGIDGILFSGSYEIGLKIKKQILSDYWKMAVLVMGGKNGQIIWDDCYYKKALHESLYSAFVTTGQRSTSTSSLLVHDKIFDRFLEDFHSLSKKCRIGYGLVSDESKAPFMGPMLNEEVLEHYLRYQGIATREGCEEIMRGKPLEKEKRGYYVSPSIHVVNRIDPKSVYQKEEILGPNVAFYRIKDLEEAIEIINQTQHGLVCSLYSAKQENYLKLVEEVKVGALHWNRPTVEMPVQLPMGGIKKSGNHRPVGSFATYQCTYPLGSLEDKGQTESSRLPKQLPRLE
ncbi:MAG: aldehyde dehydrogenase family protein [Deltaproteobacteria bacterium]|nr:aldehyde dehydrogenase family protein [Deltaproteobacteria bacterium]